MKFINIFIFVLHFALGKEGIGPGEQEWGYFSVRPGAYTFWWLYYTTATVERNYYEKPLIIWLQGGPGVSSTGFGNFMEIGPMDENLKTRNYTWVKFYNVLFIDNPVGTGFSYVEDDSLLASGVEQIAVDLKECIKNFYNKFPEFSLTPTFIVGESYGGKYTVELAKIWYEEQKNQKIRSNLKGIALGDAFISPVDIAVAMGDYLFQIGTIDEKDLKFIKSYNEKLKLDIEREKWVDAHSVDRKILETIYDASKNINLYNIAMKKVIGKASTQVMNLEFSFLMNRQIKKALALNSTFIPFNYKVYDALDEDFMKSVAESVESLLNNTDIKVYVYNGQFDAIVPTPGVIRWINNLKWINSTKWNSAERSPFIVENVIQGYYKHYGNLKMFWINRSGHMVPSDNPYTMLAIMEDFTCSPDGNKIRTFEYVRVD